MRSDQVNAPLLDRSFIMFIAIIASIAYDMFQHILKITGIKGVVSQDRDHNETELCQ